jgi:hypothetical protein
MFACPPMRNGALWRRPIAKPARRPHYVVPCSHLLDPPYAWMHDPRRPPWAQGRWPFPRQPFAYESETRAPGTGLIWGKHRHWRPC